MLQMETHRYDIELKSEDNETPVARHPVTVQVSVRCFMHELHKVTPLEPLSETDWQCVRQLVAEAPALRFCAADFRPLFCLCQTLLEHYAAPAPAKPTARPSTASARPKSLDPTQNRVAEPSAALASVAEAGPAVVPAPEVFQLGDEDFDWTKVRAGSAARHACHLAVPRRAAPHAAPRRTPHAPHAHAPHALHALHAALVAAPALHARSSWWGRTRQTCVAPRLLMWRADADALSLDPARPPRRRRAAPRRGRALPRTPLPRLRSST